MKLRTIGKSLMWISGAAVAGYAAYVTTAWIRYGRPASARTEDSGPLLARFMPAYDVVEGITFLAGWPFLPRLIPVTSLTSNGF